MIPIFIPSKARPFNCSLIKMLHELDVKNGVTIVLEKEDFQQYNSLYPQFNYIILPFSNQGIAYVRNYIKNYCASQHILWFWMMDDDITNFYTRNGTSMVKSPVGEVLSNAEKIFLGLPNIAQASLEYQQLSWSTTKDYKLNSYNDVCVCINSKLTEHIKYRSYVAMKEDRDFTMQLISKGFDTCRILSYAFAAPKNGSNSGGLKEIAYDIAGREEIAVQRMVELWGERICQPITKPDGRKDVRIKWKEINSKQTSLF